MTEDELAKIEVLTNAATPGPWSLLYHKNGACSVVGPSTNEFIGPNDIVADPSYSDRIKPDDNANMAFTAAARDAVPALVAEVRRMTADIDDLKRDLDSYMKIANTEAAESERLREALSNLVQINERWNSAVENTIGRPTKWSDEYLSEARKALGGEE